MKVEKINCSTCEYIETLNGDKYLVNICDKCKENPMLIIVATTISVAELTNKYIGLAQAARKYKEELKEIKQLQDAKSK